MPRARPPRPAGIAPSPSIARTGAFSCSDRIGNCSITSVTIPMWRCWRNRRSPDLLLFRRHRRRRSDTDNLQDAFGILRAVVVDLVGVVGDKAAGRHRLEPIRIVL